MLIGERNRPRSGKHGLSLVPSIAGALNNLLFCCNGLRGRELTAGHVMRTLNSLEFSGREPGVEIAPHLDRKWISPIPRQEAVTWDPVSAHLQASFALEILVA